MKNKLTTFPLLAMLYFCLAVPLIAAENKALKKESPSNDLVKLVHANLSDEVLFAWVDALSECPEIGTEKILKLKEQNVPEKLIAALIRRSATLNKKVEPQPQPQKKSQPAETKTEEIKITKKKERKAEKPFTREEAVTYTYRKPSTIHIAQSPTYVYYRSSPTCYTYPNYSYYQSPYHYSSYSSYPSFSLGFSLGHHSSHHRGSHYYGHSNRHYGHSVHNGYSGHRGHSGKHHNHHRSKSRF